MGASVSQEGIERLIRSVHQFDDSMALLVAEVGEMRREHREHNAQMELHWREQNAMMEQHWVEHNLQMRSMTDALCSLIG